MKRNTTFELAFEYLPARGSRQQALYEALRLAIVSGQLLPGARLPSTRDLARSYAIARLTAIAAFEQLAAEGYIVARQGAGTFVRSQLPDMYLSRPRAKFDEAQSPQQSSEPILSRRGATLANSSFPIDSLQSIKPLSPHLPDLGSFPWDEWTRVLAHSSRRLRPIDHAGGDALGYAPLRQAIADYLTTARGVRCTADHIMIVSGTQQSVDLVARLLLNPGDRVLMEDPGYPGAERLFVAQGAKPTPVPVDEEGMRACPPTARFTHARLAYLTPAHQAPTGAALSLSRRHALLTWAHDHGSWILEDDYDSEYRYVGQPLPAMQGLDRNARVLHAGSFGKTLFPALRLGYLVLPPTLVPSFAAARSLTDRYAPIEPQAALATFINSGRYARHLRCMRQIYGERRSILVEEVTRRFDGILTFGGDSAGLETIAWLPSSWNDQNVAQRAQSSGIGVESISQRYLSDKYRRPGLLMGFAATPPAAIRKAVERLGTMVDGLVSTTAK